MLAWRVALTGADERRLRLDLAKAFSVHRRELASALFEALKEADGSAGFLPERFAELHEWWQAVIETAVDLAGEWLATPDTLEEEQFSGWITRLNHPSMRPGGAGVFSAGRILECTKPRWLAIVEGAVPAEAARKLGEELDRAIGVLSRPMRKTLRVLLIGDCLMSELVTGVTGPCVRAQIGIDPVYTYSGVHAVLRNEIRELGTRPFDLVFFSPFSYTFAPDYDQVLRWNANWWPRAKFFGVLDRMLEEVAQTVRLLTERLACPIYVHNSACVVQTFGWWSGAAKNVLSLRSRAQARPFIGQRIERIAADPAFEGRVRVIDEAALRKKAGDFALGKVLFRGNVHHPTQLSMELAHGPYAEAIAAAALLAAKKVVVCDLDNTLWKGVIGEGPVEHLIERQKTLKGLRNKGVLLGINSKNDPKNVDFSGAVLAMDDFVAPRINWAPKVPNMASIVEELNLKEKDFVFIDDRPDELERVRNAFPAMIALDANDESTWWWLAHWERHLAADQLEDRTKLYHERAAREEFLTKTGGAATGQEDEAAALRNLQLTVRIEQAARTAELKRAVELVNRTNQFNLCGSRVTLAELERASSSEQWVLTAAAKDKFGSMGVVGAMVAKRTAEGLEVSVFVLSCRVFGFGIEYALLNAVKGLAAADRRLVGRFKETPSNGPCREFYAKAGLAWDGSDWTGTIGELKATPEWLTVESAAAGTLD
ncbi:MAG: HAD-IIIC family phosphatase [Terracidiphilus sp.]|jgi:FkbH-like protein